MIPRQVDQQRSSPPRLRILDLCTGTGCIPLLLYSLLYQRAQDIHLCAIDTSLTALKLARENIDHNIRLGYLDPMARKQMDLIQDDIFNDNDMAWRKSDWDIVISNPPYISPNSYNHTTSRSVRNYEPKAALVPPRRRLSSNENISDDIVGDMFYQRLLHITHIVGAKLLLMEVADMAQATRVVNLALKSGVWSGCEIWRDEPSGGVQSRQESVDVLGRNIKVIGQGDGRAVMVWKEKGSVLFT